MSCLGQLLLWEHFICHYIALSEKREREADWVLFKVARVDEIKIGFYGVVFLQFGNTNQVIQNSIPKFRQSSIISEKPGYIIKTQKFRRNKISDFFSVRILIRPKFWVVRNYFLPKFFENRIFLFFFAVTQMKIYIEDQFWGWRKHVGKKNTVLLILVMYQYNQ